MSFPQKISTFVLDFDENMGKSHWKTGTFHRLENSFHFHQRMILRIHLKINVIFLIIFLSNDNKHQHEGYLSSLNWAEIEIWTIRLICVFLKIFKLCIFFGKFSRPCKQAFNRKRGNWVREYILEKPNNIVEFFNLCTIHIKLPFAKRVTN